MGTSRVQGQVSDSSALQQLSWNPRPSKLADRPVQRTGPGSILFCNSGAEANEALIKLARSHGRRLSDGEEGRHKVVCANIAFHGRTFGGMSATPQEKIQSGFHPMLDGFRFGELNDIDSFEQLVDDSVAAVFIETIQGEGGIFPAESALSEPWHSAMNVGYSSFWMKFSA